MHDAAGISGHGARWQCCPVCRASRIPDAVHRPAWQLRHKSKMLELTDELAVVRDAERLAR
jgi:hypothetical protein